MSNISILGDYRLAFIKPGQVTGNEMVNIDLTPTPSPFSPWPKRVVGKVTTSVAELHNKGCPLSANPQRFVGDKVDIFTCCKCPAWRKYLRSEIKKGLKAY